jgi:predicted ABC-type ATPase
MNKPRIIIIGGANGSGKTTLTLEYVNAEKIDYLSADEIAYRLE